MTKTTVNVLNTRYKNNEYSELIDFVTLYVNLQEALINKILITVANNKYIIMDGNKNILFRS